MFVGCHQACLPVIPKIQIRHIETDSLRIRDGPTATPTPSQSNDVLLHNTAMPCTFTIKEEPTSLLD
jgi:hypothetical protein